MGIKSPLDNNPSLALGSNDVNLLELVNAYGTVADDGMHVDPVFITKIVDSDGNVIFENKLEETRALSKEAAFYMQKLLEASVYDAGGTSQPIAAGQYLGPYMKTLSIGGKTGTSNNHSDAWFVGVTPSLVAGAWVGGKKLIQTSPLPTDLYYSSYYSLLLVQHSPLWQPSSVV